MQNHNSMLLLLLTSAAVTVIGPCTCTVIPGCLMQQIVAGIFWLHSGQLQPKYTSEHGHAAQLHAANDEGRYSQIT